MKRTILFLAVISLSAAANAQVASWLIPPVYDDIFKMRGADLLVSDSVGETSLWTFEGRRIFKTTDTMFPFQENMAVVTKRGTTELLGFVSTRGEFITLDGLLLAQDYPYFSEKLLAVKSKKDGVCAYIDMRGRKAIKNCASAYPFCNGFAKCEAYHASQAKKVYSNLLLDRMGRPVKFSYNGKKLASEDISFLSSVNDDNLAVVVANQKVYLFDAKTQQLQPVFAGHDTNIEHQAQVEGEPANFWRDIDGSESELFASSNGKEVIFRFNKLCQPIEMSVDGTEKTYTQRERPEWDPETSLKITIHNGRYGINIGDKKVLPPQFAEAPDCFDNKAFVKMRGKTGLLHVKENEAFEFSMNKGNDIAFRHQRVETTLRVDLPPSVSVEDAAVEMDPDTGCEIDVTSREAKTTNFGSSLLYGCILTIPDNLSDETKEVDYQASVTYDGLTSAPIPFKASEWYYKFFNVNVEDVETVIKNGNLLFTFNITADKLPGEDDYPSTASVRAGNLPVKLEKLSESRYRCSVRGLREGVNQVIIQIKEPGCPVTEYPFEVSYTKPAARSAAKENVVIKNNSKPKRPAPPQPAKQQKKPRLEI